MLKKPRTHASALRRAREEVHQALRSTELLCRGTLVTRTKLCGKSSCRCAKDPKARHGPYHEWGRMEDDRLVNTMVSPQQAARLGEAIEAHRRLQRLLRRWEMVSARAILES